jgi:hypothetical protein
MIAAILRRMESHHPAAQGGSVMDTSVALIVVAAIVVVGAVVIAGMLATARRRSTHLKDQFGPEYDRTVRETGDRRHAERELLERDRRVKKLPIRPLAPGEKSRYSELWHAQQARFVDNPESAVNDADHLVEEVMRVRGYPVADFERNAADISVDHPHVVEEYRAGHEIAVRHKNGQATTEDLRNAMLHYRRLFEDLLQDGGVAESYARG